MIEIFTLFKRQGFQQLQDDMKNKEINTAELQKQSRQLTSEKMKLYDDYKDGRMNRDSYKQRAEKISVQLDEIKQKIEDAEIIKAIRVHSQDEIEIEWNFDDIFSEQR